MARLSGLILKGGIDKTMLDLVRPVNSLYLTVGSEDPNTVFGGTWVKLTGGVLACAGTSGYAAAGSTGGSLKISVNQMPSHTHTIASSGNYAVDSPLALYYTTSTAGNNWRMWSSNTQSSEGVVYNKNTGGGRITTRSICPSTFGKGRRRTGVPPWLGSSSERVRPSSATARIRSARTSIAPSTRTPSGSARLGSSRFRETISSPQGAPTFPEARTGATRTRSRSERCRGTCISPTFNTRPYRHKKATPLTASALRGMDTMPTSTRRRVGACPITTCRSQSRFRSGSGLNNEKHGEVIPHAA